MEFDIPKELQEQGSSSITKDGMTVLVVYNGKPIRFDIVNSWNKTIQSFEKQAKILIKDQATKQAIIFFLSNEWNKIINKKSATAEVEAEKEDSTSAALQSSEEQEIIQQQIDPCTQLDPYIPDRDYVEFAIRTAKKTVKCEDSLVRQITYTGLSKDSADPINLAVLAPTSEGKTYAVLETLQFFPKEDVWKVGSMSPKVIIRQNGILVDGNNEPIEGKISDLKKQIRDCEKNGEDDDQAGELKGQLGQLYQEAKVLIDLRGKLFVFLEPPHPHTWDILKPILSHDGYEIDHPYVDEVGGMGFKVKKVVTRGWPACIFCSAKNESNWPAWPEIASRFLITSPNMVPQKVLEGNKLIAQRMGLPKLLQESLVVSEKDVELAKKCVLYLIQQMEKFIITTGNTANNNNNNNSSSSSNRVWIPFGEMLAEILPSEKGTALLFYG
jgi:hypothetical protein